MHSIGFDIFKTIKETTIQNIYFLISSLGIFTLNCRGSDKSTSQDSDRIYQKPITDMPRPSVVCYCGVCNNVSVWTNTEIHTIHITMRSCT